MYYKLLWVWLSKAVKCNQYQTKWWGSQSHTWQNKILNDNSGKQQVMKYTRSFDCTSQHFLIILQNKAQLVMSNAVGQSMTPSLKLKLDNYTNLTKRQQTGQQKNTKIHIPPFYNMWFIVPILSWFMCVDVCIHTGSTGERHGWSRATERSGAYSGNSADLVKKTKYCVF